MVLTYPEIWIPTTVFVYAIKVFVINIFCYFWGGALFQISR